MCLTLFFSDPDVLINHKSWKLANLSKSSLQDALPFTVRILGRTQPSILPYNSPVASIASYETTGVGKKNQWKSRSYSRPERFHNIIVLMLVHINYFVERQDQ